MPDTTLSSSPVVQDKSQTERPFFEGNVISPLTDSIITSSTADVKLPARALNGRGVHVKLKTLYLHGAIHPTEVSLIKPWELLMASQAVTSRQLHE